MAIKLHKKGIALSREERIKEDENLTIIENSINGFQSQVDTLVVSGDSSVEAAQARVPVSGPAYVNLKDRLDTEHQKVTATLADKASKEDLQQVSLSFKESYDTIADLQSTYPNGDEYNHAVLADGFIYTWNQLGSWVSTEIQANGTGVANNTITMNKLYPNAVTPDKTSFLQVVSNNLFNKDTAMPDRSISASTGNPAVSSGNYLSDFIRITGSTQYIVDGVARIGYYTESYSFISTSLPNSIETLLTPPENAVYIRLVITGLQRLDVAQINSGDTLRPYDLYKVRVLNLSELEENSVKPVHTNFMKSSANLLNTKVADVGIVINDAGIMEENVEYSSSEFIEVEGDASYYLQDAIKIAYFSESEVYLSKDWIDASKSGFIITPPEARFVKVSYFTRDTNTTFITKSEVEVEYEPFGFTIDGLVTPDASDYTKTYSNSEPIPTEWYQSPVMDGYEAPSHYTDSITLDEIYSDYDDIVANQPSYAKKTELGLDESGQYPVYKYELIPENVASGFFVKAKPKIILFTSVHGEEKSSTVSLRNFIKEVATNWKSDPLLEYLRFNVHFVIVPVVNPYGFVNFHRKNSNSVDINRNSEYRWETSSSSDPTAQAYKGTAPFSEVESQYVRDTILANTDAIACFDYHMNGSSGSDYETMFWHYIENFNSKKGFEELNILSKNNISKLTRESQMRYGIPETSGFVGYISYNSNSSTIAAYAYSKGIPATTIECTRKIVGEVNVYSATTIQLCTEFIGNAILNTVRQYVN